MVKIIKKIICIFFILILTGSYAFAQKKQTTKAAIQTDFVLKEATEDIVFTTYEDIELDKNTVIPKGAVVYAKNYQAQRALRWHKGGFILCKVIKYSKDEFSSETIDISDKDFYLVAKKYEKVYKKEAAIIATEIILSQGASFFAPGTDVLYFFTKGAIQRKKNPNWFKAGVSNAYENSICWFWLKGKTINLAQGDDINIRIIEKEKADKLKTKMVKRKTREDIQALKKELKQEFKIVKKTEKQEIKQLKKELKEEEKIAKDHIKNDTVADENLIEIKDVHAAVKLEKEGNAKEEFSKKKRLNINKQ